MTTSFFALEEKCEKFSGKSFLAFFYMLKKSKMWYNFRDYVVNLVYDLILSRRDRDENF